MTVSRPMLSFQTRGAALVARAELSELTHPEQVEEFSRTFHDTVATSAAEAVVLDLTGLEYLTSAALGMLLNFHAHIQRQGRRFAIAASSPQVCEVLGHTRLEHVFPVAADVDAALAEIT